MSQNVNQFAITQEKGTLDLSQTQGGVLSCVVASTETTTLVAGQAVKLAATSTGAPKVLATTADTDKTFGFVVRNLKDAGRVAGEPLEVAIVGSIMVMQAGAAIVAQKSVEVDVSEIKVKTAAGTNPVVGITLDAATADGDLVRVLISSPVSV